MAEQNPTDLQSNADEHTAFSRGGNPADSGGPAAVTGSHAGPVAAPSAADGEPYPSLLAEIGAWLVELWADVLSSARWLAQNPLALVSLLGIAGLAVYFYGIYHPFYIGLQSVAYWASLAWRPDSSQGYCAIVPWVALGLLLYHRRDARRAAAEGQSHWPGLLLAALGVAVFILAVRSVNPRMALGSVPFLLYGGFWMAGGRASARVFLFPCALLFFMIPMGAIEQATSNLQFIITGVVGTLARLMGLHIQAQGTTLVASDGAFNFEIAEGCSGINSLMAMVMITSVYVHLTQNRQWKKAVIFAASLLFAIVGNIGRIFTIILVARFYDPQFAHTTYHDYSGFIFFPIAILAMLGFSWLVNRDYRRIAEKAVSAVETAAPASAEGGAGADGKPRDTGPTPYDY